jgi:hypothetical protein
MDRLRLPVICGVHYSCVRIKGQPVQRLKTQLGHARPNRAHLAAAGKLELERPDKDFPLSAPSAIIAGSAGRMDF